jgi:ABC-type branched-subunit amino acid transport system substrate-binding protein
VAVNAKGGIDRHRLVVDACDDQDSLSVALTCGETLVNTDHVVAFVAVA